MISIITTSPKTFMLTLIIFINMIQVYAKIERYLEACPKYIQLQYNNVMKIIE